MWSPTVLPSPVSMLITNPTPAPTARPTAVPPTGRIEPTRAQQGGVKGQLDVFGVFHAALGAVQAFGFVVQQQAPGGLAGGAVDAVNTVDTVDTVNSALQGDGAEGGDGIVLFLHFLLLDFLQNLYKNNIPKVYLFSALTLNLPYSVHNLKIPSEIS